MSAPRPIITLLSDFGDLYPAAMKGVILGIAPNAVLVDITHSIPPQDVTAGALALQAAAPCFPRGTVHLAVVDPGVGTARACLAVRSGGHWLVGPDNGLLLPAARRLAAGGVPEILRIENWNRLSPQVSPTFHGRDVFAPVAAHIALDDGVVRLAPHPGFVDLDFGAPREAGGGFELRVIYVDSFGNLVTNAAESWVGVHLHPDRTLKVEGQAATLVSNYAAAPRLLALVGSHGYLEFAESGSSAALRLCKGTGDALRIEL